MSDLAAWLYSLVAPFAKRVLSSLGLGWVTYEGLTTLLQNLRDSVMSSWGAMAPTVYDILALSGFLDAFGIILGAMASIAALSMVSKLGRIVA